MVSLFLLESAKPLTKRQRLTLGVDSAGLPLELAYPGARRARQFLDSDKRATGAVFRQLDSYN